VEEWFEIAGVKPGKLDDADSGGVINDYRERCRNNIRFFEELTNYLTDNPPRFEANGDRLA